MLFSPLKNRLIALDQKALFQKIEDRSLSEQVALFEQLQAIEPKMLARLQAARIAPQKRRQNCVPFKDYERVPNLFWKNRGKELLKEGKVGTLLVAGGQGTRLGFQGPKGAFPLSSMGKQTLFQLFSEEIKRKNSLVKKQAPLAILTSFLNHSATVEFFVKHHYFGLDPKGVSFFQQPSLPFLDLKGNLILEKKGDFSFGPDGNGSSLFALISSGIFLDWWNLGVRYLIYVLIDNPLADPLDTTLLGYHDLMGHQVTLKGTLRKNAQEKVGVVVKQDSVLKVLEYFEGGQDLLDEEVVANLSLFCFSMDWIKEVAGPFFPYMPIHATKKPVLQDGELGWKFERFIFDLLPKANKSGVLVYPRETCFAPLKNASGEDSPETVLKALINLKKL